MQYLCLLLLLLLLQPSAHHNRTSSLIQASAGEIESHLPEGNNGRLFTGPAETQCAGCRHLDTAISYIGIVEKTNHNDGPEVEKFLECVDRKKGDSWCAAFVSYCLTAGKVLEPKIRTGLARNFKQKKSIKAQYVLIGRSHINPGAIVVWEKGGTIFGHVGFVESWNRQYGRTIEGNTSSSNTGNQSNGDGVYRRNRIIQPGSYFRITCFTLVRE